MQKAEQRADQAEQKAAAAETKVTDLEKQMLSQTVRAQAQAKKDAEEAAASGKKPKPAALTQQELLAEEAVRCPACMARLPASAQQCWPIQHFKRQTGKLLHLL